MMRYAKYTEWLYAVVAVLAGIETYAKWGQDGSKAYLFLFFTIISIGMFFFRRHYRKKFEKRNNS